MSIGSRKSELWRQRQRQRRSNSRFQEEKKRKKNAKEEDDNDDDYDDQSKEFELMYCRIKNNVYHFNTRIIYYTMIFIFLSNHITTEK